MFDKLTSVENKYEQLAAEMADPAVQADNAKFRAHSKAVAEMQPLVETCIESRSMPVDRRASLRGTLWSLLFIAAGGAIVLAAVSLVDLF